MIYDFTIYDIQTGEIEQNLQCVTEDPEWISTHNEGKGTAKGKYDKGSFYFKDGEPVEYTEEQKNAKSVVPTIVPIGAPVGTTTNSPWHRWSNETMSYSDSRTAEEIFTFNAASVRATRDILLAETDWTENRSVPEATFQKWAPYRQALRDITNQTGFPSSVVWPEKP